VPAFLPAILALLTGFVSVRNRYDRADDYLRLRLTINLVPLHGPRYRPFKLGRLRLSFAVTSVGSPAMPLSRASGFTIRHPGYATGCDLHGSLRYGEREPLSDLVKVRQGSIENPRAYCIR
jgi:hypothetical protein